MFFTYPVHSERPSAEIMIRWPYPDNEAPDLYVGETYTIEIKLVDPKGNPIPNEDIVTTLGMNATMDILVTDRDEMVDYEFTVDSSSDQYYIAIEWAGNEEYGGYTELLIPETIGGASSDRTLTPRERGVPSYPVSGIFLGVLLSILLNQKRIQQAHHFAYAL